MAGKRRLRLDEHMATPEGSNYEDGESIGKSFEASGGSWAIFKLVRHLISSPGRPARGMGGNRPCITPSAGRFHEADDSQRRGKRPSITRDYYAWAAAEGLLRVQLPCCSGTYPQAVAEYHNMIYYLGRTASILPSVCSVGIDAGGSKNPPGNRGQLSGKRHLPGACKVPGITRSA